MNSTDVVALFEDDKILSFDLELTRDEKLRHLGALLADRELNLKGPQDLSLKELNALAQGLMWFLATTFSILISPGWPNRLYAPSCCSKNRS
jgi:hypothetical protein